MAPCALVFDFQDIASAPSNHPWLSATATALLFLFAYVLMRQRHYRLLCNRARECPHVASITVMGGISEELQSRQVELMLRGELAAIADAYRNFSKLQTDVASTDVLMDAPGFELDLHGTIKFGGVEIPLPVITNLLRVPILHLRSRLEYLGLLIHVSLVSVGEHTQVLVYREGRNVPRPLPANGSATAPRPTALEKTAQITNVSAVPGLIRDTAFMILQLHGTVDRNRQLVSVRHFTEGLKALKAHALIDHPELQTRAKQEFHLAVHEDPHYYEALYFYATLTLEERTEDSINSAITLFRRALEATLMGQNTSAPILGVDQVNVQKRRKDQHCKRLGLANAGWRIATSNKPTAWKVVPMQRGMLASMPKKQASSGPPPTRTPTHGFFTCKPSLASSTTQERSRLPTRTSVLPQLPTSYAGPSRLMRITARPRIGDTTTRWGGRCFRWRSRAFPALTESRSPEARRGAPLRLRNSTLKSPCNWIPTTSFRTPTSVVYTLPATTAPSRNTWKSAVTMDSRRSPSTRSTSRATETSRLAWYDTRSSTRRTDTICEPEISRRRHQQSKSALERTHLRHLTRLGLAQERASGGISAEPTSTKGEVCC